MTNSAHAAARSLAVVPLQSPSPSWSPAARVGFRLAFAYFVLYSFPFPIGAIPGTEKLGDLWTRLWNLIVPWIGKHWLHISYAITTADNGSGDKTADYIIQLCFTLLAVIIALGWSVADRRRESYPRLREALRVYVRYVLAFAMLSYGFAKVFKLQFPFPPDVVLQQTYGSASPMRLLWTFMGYSLPYTVFAGAAEVTGGALLLFRRTTTLGALVILAVMTNVVMLNFCYDVPVKLYSSNLLLMSVYLLGPDLQRLADVLVLHRPTQPASFALELPRRWMRITRVALKAGLIGAALFGNIKGSIERMDEYGDWKPKRWFEASWEVVEVARDGQTLPPLLTDKTRWRRIWFGYDRMTITNMDESRGGGYGAALDEAKHTLTLTSDADQQKSTLTYSLDGNGDMTLEGRVGKEQLRVRVHKIDRSQLLLVQRGFHWINESPPNR